MCASNVSKVLFLSGSLATTREGVETSSPRSAARAARPQDVAEQGEVHREAELDPHVDIPAGNARLGPQHHVVPNPGDQHVGIIGHTDRGGVVWIYQNNWYRPENEGRAKPSWSPTRTSVGFPASGWRPRGSSSRSPRSIKVTDVKTMIPAIDDMDPFNLGYAADARDTGRDQAEL